MVKTPEEWDEMHREDRRGWDLKGVTPALRHFVATQADVCRQVRSILVPGCGQKHDCEFLATSFPEAQVVGLDISPAAVEACRKTCAAPNVHFLQDDFFHTKLTEAGTACPTGPFDLVYDYTFFCAIDPRLRGQWGSQMARLVAPSGHLLTLMFPLGDVQSEMMMPTEGPPFAVSFAAYESVLTSHFSLVMRDRDFAPSNSVRAGREELALWRRNKH